jgi:hypothetical protein
MRQAVPKMILQAMLLMLVVMLLVMLLVLLVLVAKWHRLLHLELECLGCMTRQHFAKLLLLPLLWLLLLLLPEVSGF